MPLKTVQVPRRQGRVCYVTEERGVPHATVECAVEREAYRLPWESGRVAVGDWVSFEGETRLEVVGRDGDEDRLRRVPYYHDPYDGSDRSGWSYFDLRNPQKLRRIGPLEAVEALEAAREALRVHLDAWYSNDSPGRLRDTLSRLEAAQDALRKVLRERSELTEEAGRAAVVDIDV